MFSSPHAGNKTLSCGHLRHDSSPNRRRTAWKTDGIQLSRFNVGDTYDIPPSLAIYLIANRHRGGQRNRLDRGYGEQGRDKIRESLVARKRAEKKR